MASAQTAEQLWKQGLEDSDHEQYPQAIDKYKQAVELDHNFAPGYMSWASALPFTTDPNAALTELQQTIEQYYDEATGHLIVGNAYLNQDRYEEAIAEYEKALAKDDKLLEAYLNCAEAYNRQNQYDKAIEYLQRALEYDPNSTAAYQKWGHVLEFKNDRAGAIEKYKTVLAIDPKNMDALSDWSFLIIELAEADMETELELFRQRVEKDFANVKAYFLLAEVLRNAAKFADAIAVNQQIIQLDPKNYIATTNCAEFYAILGKEKNAIDYYQRAIKLDPKSDTAYFGWAQLLVDNNDTESAIAIYKEGLQHAPEKGVYLDLWALDIRYRVHPDAELDAFRAAIEQYMPDADGYVKLGRLLCNVKRYQDAIETYQRAIELQPDKPDVYLAQAAAYVELKDYPATIGLYKQAFRADPNNMQILYEWSVAIARLPDPEPEINAFRNAIEQYSPTGESYDYLGVLYWNLLRNREALDIFQIAASKAPNAEFIQVHLGYALEQHDDMDGAIQAYQAAIKNKPDYAPAYRSLSKLYSHIGEDALALANTRKAIEFSHLDTNNYYVWLNNIIGLDDREAETERDIFIRKALDNLDKNDANRLIGILQQIRFKQYEDAQKYFNESIAANRDNSQSYYNLGNLLGEMFRYDEAIENYQQAIKINEHHRKTEQIYYSYYYHNHASILQTQGRFKDARRKWLETVKAYLDYIEEFGNAVDPEFYFYYGSICQEVFKDFHSAEQAYQHALAIYPGHHTPLIALAKLYLEHQENALSDNETDRTTRNHCYFKAWNAYRQAEKLITDKKNLSRDTDTTLDLVNLYIAFRKYDEAKRYLKKVQHRDPHNKKVVQAAGVVALKTEDYEEAIKQLRAARVDEPDNLEMRANLARAYQQLKRYDEAEKVYREILSTSRFHVDSLIGLSQIYIADAENANTKGNSGEAVVFLNKAINELTKLLDYTDLPEVHLPDVPQRVLDAPISRPLSQKEISSVYYLIGYAYTRLFDARKITDPALLRQADTCFNKVKYGTPNYFKAERARGKIQDLQSSLAKSMTRTSTLAVTILAVTVFVIAQFGFLVGKPVYGYTDLQVNPAALELFLKQHKVDFTKYKSQIDGLESSRFVMEQEIATAINTMLDKKQIGTEQLSALIQRGGEFGLKGFEKIGDVSYTLMTFGSLIFFVAGLFLREITKLRFGAVELEKASMDQVAATPSLNISL